MNRKTFVDDHVMAYVKNCTNRKVFSGPFSGMNILDEYSWSNLDSPSKLIGTYEQELHPHLLRMTTFNFDCIVDIGCAEGYYAVGLAILYPAARVYAYDNEEHARAICLKNALSNGVQDRLIIEGECTAEILSRHATTYLRPLIFCDCEGHEAQIFKDKRTRSSLSAACLIIECHDFVVPNTTQTILEYFADTHTVIAISSGSRNPNKFPFMLNISEFDRWRAVCEYRPCAMNWVICYPKNCDMVA